MSSNFLNNLSYSMNLPSVTIESEGVVKAVNRVLSKFYSEKFYEDYLNFYKISEKTEKQSAVMQSEKVILCEINAGLWSKALQSAISSLTQYTYPHYIIVEEFINYLFNANTDENFGLLEDFFWKLLLFYPPHRNMFDYYWKILFEHFVTLTDGKKEDENLFFCLIKMCISCFESLIDNSEDHYAKTFNKKEMGADEKLEQRIEKELENCNISLNDTSETFINKKKMFFYDLPSKERLERCMIALNFVYNILETDFVIWLYSHKLKPSFQDTRPLLTHLLWSQTRDIGLINKEINKVLALYELSIISSTVLMHNKNIIKKFIHLIGEVIRCSDSIEEIKYPFVGVKCNNFLREISIILNKYLVKMGQNKEFLNRNELLVNLKPPWLRLYLCSHLLSSLGGSQCLPELTSAYDVLEHLVHNESRCKDEKKIVKKPKSPVNTRVLQKLKKLNSINTKLANGKTHLHVACEQNSIEKIKALLTFPELDVNANDREGWTALHRAANLGNVPSVQELLSFCPTAGDVQRSVNTRAKGPDSITPLMCAASRGHASICKLLLEHSGSVLLDDVNEQNQTAMELSSTPEVKKVLEYYKKNNVRTFYSHSGMNFDEDKKEVVLRLCVEMIQAYFCTYRIWDVYKCLKRSEKIFPDESTPISDLEDRWDYLRYHRDIKRNIFKLRKLMPKLETIKEFKELNEVYVRLLSFNKVC